MVTPAPSVTRAVTVRLVQPDALVLKDPKVAMEILDHVESPAAMETAV